MSRGRHYSAEFKREAIALVTPDRRWREVAAEVGVPEGTFWRWVVAHREVAALRRIAELERENEFLGKASAYFARKHQP